MITNIQVNLPSSYIPYENLEPNEEFHKSYLDSLPLVGCLQLPGMFLISILALGSKLSQLTTITNK